MVKFQIQTASRLILDQKGVDMETAQAIRAKGLPVNFVHMSEDEENYITTVDVLHLQDFLVLLNSIKKSVIDMDGFPTKLPTITVYDDFIE